MPHFKIDQIALAPFDAVKGQEFLKKIGLTNWFFDHVVAIGEVFGTTGRNEADLRFNYQAGNGSEGGKELELEILDYTKGESWLDSRPTDTVSHLGMHCTAAALKEWRKFMEEEGVAVAQEVVTESHTNPTIAGERRYNYVIFDTKDLIGVDLKFIVRLTQEGEPFEVDHK